MGKSKSANCTLCADAIVLALSQQGITDIFGYPGAAICPFYDALYLFNKNNKNKIKHILVRQEQNAGHAASGYARISGKPSVCVATSGPGALNLIPAIACAYMDSIPMIIITGQVSSELLGRDVFQEADITGSAEPFVKHSYLVRDGNEIFNIIAEAFLIANSGRKGPVLIDIPVDVLLSHVDFPKEKTVPICPIGYHMDLADIDKTALFNNIAKVKSALMASHRPLLCIGGGIFSANAQQELLDFIENCNLPFVCTMMGISAISPLNSHFLGMLGDYGEDTANKAIEECDLLFLIGARAGDRAIKSDNINKKVICHLDIDPCELNKNMQTDIQLNGNAKTILPHFSSDEALKRNHWTENIKSQDNLAYNETLFAEIFKKLNHDAIVVSDVGRHLIYCTKAYNLENGRFLASGGMGTMGYSLPAAIGACLCAKNRQVIVFCGDGGFQMNMMELATVMREKLPIKLVLLDNHCLGLVKELQDEQYHGNEIAVDMKDNPDFSFISNAYGIKSISIAKADTQKEREEKIVEFLKEKSACMLICQIDA